MSDLRAVEYLSEEQYLADFNAGILDDNTIYATPQEPTYSQAQIDKKISNLEEQIANAGDSVDAYTKTETDALLEDKADKNTTYTKTEVDEIKQDLQDQITTATGGEYSKVLVGGKYQPTFNADTKADVSELNKINQNVLSLDSMLDSLVSQIADEIADRKNADTEINNTLLTKADKSEVNTITEKIPTQASTTNPLADKEFVNSSISTSTATFRGTVNSISELPTGGIDLNDYAFVKTTDSSGNTLYQRYKYDGSAWVFEYELNNSSFTASQWASINSGITTDLVNQIGTNETSIEDLNTNKADKTEIPKSTSELTNDSGFITSSDIPDTSNFVQKSGDTMTGPLAVNAEPGKYDYTKSVSASFPEGTFYTTTKVSVDGIKVNAKSTYVSGSIFWSMFSYDQPFSGTLPITVSVGSVSDYGKFSLEIRDITEDGMLEIYPTNETFAGRIEEGGPLGLNITVQQTFEGTSDISTNRVSADTVSANKVFIQNETPTRNDEAIRKDYVDGVVRPLKTKLDDMPYYIVALTHTGAGGSIRLARTPTENFGYQIVWGKASQSTNNKAYTQNFPQSFSYAPSLVTGAYSRNGQQAGKTWEHSMFYDLTSTGFTWYRTDDFDITFIAIGPWSA